MSQQDVFTIAQRIRQLRKDRGYSVTQFAELLGRAPSQVSVIENGKRDLKVAELARIAEILDVTPNDLMHAKPLTGRAALEVDFARAQHSKLYQSLDLPDLPVRKSLSDAAMRTILQLHQELERVHEERAATPEEARRANAVLRREQSERGNYYPELEEIAHSLLSGINHTRGPLTQRTVLDLAAHLGFTLHFVSDLPGSTRSITDKQRKRIYMPVTPPGVDPRSAVLQALAAAVLGKPEPKDYGDLLRQRVETNYLAGALMIPEKPAVEALREAKAAHNLAVEDVRDWYSVSYEIAAHRFSNLATKHLGIPLHFVKVHSSGVILKAYQNDGVQFPTDLIGTVEGQVICRYWSANQVFATEDRMSPYYQYTDKPGGTYWCTSRVERDSAGDFSISVGTRFSDTKWFRGRDTQRRIVSHCPDRSCCREPHADLRKRWEGVAWPSARLNSSLLAAMPTGTFTGVDQAQVFEFLERHSPSES